MKKLNIIRDLVIYSANKEETSVSKPEMTSEVIEPCLTFSDKLYLPF
ncbi:MAG: hypothetical protein H7329_08110 [Opitutaceae bacterium]|nr:hypothetical protein [Cytophagales bacterium]